jgi:hypothetical protein
MGTHLNHYSSEFPVCLGNAAVLSRCPAQAENVGGTAREFQPRQAAVRHAVAEANGMSAFGAKQTWGRPGRMIALYPKAVIQREQRPTMWRLGQYRLRHD